MVGFVWEFIVRGDQIEEFERHYASSGKWAELFRKGSGYLGTQLLRDTENPPVFDDRPLGEFRRAA